MPPSTNKHPALAALNEPPSFTPRVRWPATWKLHTSMHLPLLFQRLQSLPTNSQSTRNDCFWKWSDSIFMRHINSIHHPTTSSLHPPLETITPAYTRSGSQCGKEQRRQRPTLGFEYDFHKTITIPAASPSASSSSSSLSSLTRIEVLSIYCHFMLGRCIAYEDRDGLEMGILNVEMRWIEIERKRPESCW